MVQTSTGFALLVLFLPLSYTNAAKILAVFPHVGKSHYFMFQPYVYKLAERGHQVTIITHFPDEDPPPNVTFVDIRHPGNELFFNSVNITEMRFNTLWNPLFSFIGLMQFGFLACGEFGLGHDNIKKLLSEQRHFDLVVAEFFNTDCYASLSHVYQAPLIGMFPSVMMPWHTDRFGNPDNPAYIPNHFHMQGSKMTLLQRLYNAFLTYSLKIAYTLVSDFSSDGYVQQYVGKDIPPVRKIVNNASLFLVNSHFSIFQSRPLTPATIEIGGFHVAPPKFEKIPKDVLAYIENSPNGFIYFSLGSTIKGSTMAAERFETFKKAFSRVKENILWKWETDEAALKGVNYLMRKWLPQNEILAHPNCKLFITHSGLLGTQEAVAHGVPMIMFPFFGDQPHNAALIAEKGAGLIADFGTVTSEEMYNLIEKVTKDPSFKESAKRLQETFLDRPQSIMDTAIYWTEYVIRHKGAPHLKSQAVDLKWYQEYLLDVIAVIILFLWAVRKLIKYLKSIVVSKKADTKRKTKKSIKKE